jgi:hypothetical protein
MYVDTLTHTTHAHTESGVILLIKRQAAEATPTTPTHPRSSGIYQGYVERRAQLQMCVCVDTTHQQHQEEICGSIALWTGGRISSMQRPQVQSPAPDRDLSDRPRRSRPGNRGAIRYQCFESDSSALLGSTLVTFWFWRPPVVGSPFSGPFFQRINAALSPLYDG